MTNQNILEIFINNRKCEIKAELKIPNLGSSFNNLCIGNTQDLKLSFNGKISIFSIFQKAFTDFTEVFNSIHFNPLIFIPEAFSISTVTNSSNFKEINSAGYFDINDYEEKVENCGLLVSENLNKIDGVDFITCFCNIGGLDILLPFCKDSETLVIISILQIVSDFCQSSSLKFMVSQDFFDMLANTIENFLCPTEELLEIIKKIIARLE